MHRGVNTLLFSAALATTGCVTDTGKLNIRPLADPFTKATKAGNPAVAEGRGLLAMGSVGLAIEAFRKALIQQPDSIEALAGLAECYDQMGRPDLSRAKYEAALAIAPNDATLLRTFAVSLERQGRYAEAIALRSEAADADRADAAALVQMAPPAPAATAFQPPAARASVETKPVAAPVKAVETRPQPVSTRVRIAEVRPPLASASLVGKTEWKIEAPTMAPLPQESPLTSVTVRLPPAAAAPAVASKAAAPERAQAEVPKPATVAPVEVASVTRRVLPQHPLAIEAEPTKAAPPAPVNLAEVAATSSVTVKLPPARPAPEVPKQPIAAPTRAVLASVAPMKDGPRLERLSLGEVALLTDPRRRWQPDAARWTSISKPLSAAPANALVPPQLALNAPRFVPLAELQRNYGVRLLNAARHEGLAANTRIALNRQGWKSVTVGDSARVREKSLILYSERTEQAARRLAAQFGFWIAREARPGPLTILLGRDWVSRRQARG